MKRGKKLIALALVLVLLVGAVAAVQSLNGTEDAAGTEEVTADTGSEILKLDSGDVTALCWNYSEAVAFEKGEDGWRYAEDEAFPVDESYLTAMLSALSSVTAYKTIESPEDFDQYGLAAPVCAVTVTAEGEIWNLAIGSETAIGDQRYFSIGDGNVYLVDETMLDSFAYGLYDVLKLEEIPEMTDVTGLEVVTADQAYQITYEESSGKAYSDSYVWFMEDTPLDTELTETLIGRITSLAWSACADYNAADLKTYGLDVPAATVTVQYDQGHSFTLEIGDVTEKSCYVRLPDSNMVYLVDASVHDALCYTTRNELLPDEVLVMDWTGVTSVDVILDGETYVLEWGKKQVTDADGNTTEEAALLFAGTDVEATGITDALDGLTSAGYATGLAPEGVEQIRFVIHQNSPDFPQVELAFYPYDSASCLTTLNGTATVLTGREQVADLVEIVQTLAK